MKNLKLKPKNKKKSGFIALMSVIIISITLLAISFTRSNNGFFSRFSVLDSEYKSVGLGLAESCVNVALLKIGQDYNYNYLTDALYDSAKHGIVISVNPNSTPQTECIIKSISFGSEDFNHRKIAIIKTQGEYQSTWSNLSVSAYIQNPSYASVIHTSANDDGLTNFSIDSWTETATSY